MADHGLFIGWGQTRPGREAIPGRVLAEARAYWSGLRDAGQIESFEVVVLAAHGGDLEGFALLRGDRERLAHVRMTPEFARMTMRIEACTEHVGVVDAYVDDGVSQLMSRWQEAIADLV